MIKFLFKEHLISTNVLIFSIVIFIIGCDVRFGQAPDNKSANIPKAKINKSIENAIDFLYKAQLDYGEFRTFASNDIELKNSYFDSSPSVTATVLYSIKDIDTEKTRVMKKKAIDFLISEEEEGGIWRYWTSLNNKKIAPDLDDIALISYVLKINDIKFDDNIELIKRNREENDLFLTWIYENEQKNDVDCAVNADVLVYMGGAFPEVCEYLNSVVANNENCSKYYPDKFFVYYYIARAIENNVKCLEISKSKIISNIIEDQKKAETSISNLHNALALNTLLILGYNGKEVIKISNRILSKQNINGSWNRENAWLGPAPYYGSEELSTALSLEALYRFQKIQLAGK